MTSVVPRLTVSCPDGVYLDPALPLAPSPQSESHRPSELKLSPSEDCKTPEDNDDSFYSLKIPSPTYQIMFTPRLQLMTSSDSEDDYSDGLSEYSADVLIFTQSRRPPWTSAAEHIKPVVNRLIDEERRQHDLVRLAWRPVLPATPTTSAQSLPASSDLDSGTDALETQSSSCVACLSRHESPEITFDESGPRIRRTQSLPNNLRRSTHSTKNLSSSNKIWSNTSNIYQEKDKEDDIKRWASDISFTP